MQALCLLNGEKYHITLNLPQLMIADVSISTLHGNSKWFLFCWIIATCVCQIQPQELVTWIQQGDCNVMSHPLLAKMWARHVNGKERNLQSKMENKNRGGGYPQLQLLLMKVSSPWSSRQSCCSLAADRKQGQSALQTVPPVQIDYADSGQRVGAAPEDSCLQELQLGSATLSSTCVTCL